MNAEYDSAAQTLHEDIRARNYLITELSVVKFRWLIIGFLALYANAMKPPGWSLPLFNATLAGAAAYSIGIYLFVRKARSLPVDFSLLFMYCDMIAVAAALFFTGGVLSPLVFIWYLALLTAGIRFGFLKSLLLQAPMAVCYFFLLRHDPGPAGTGDLNRLMLGWFSLSAVALYGSFYSREEKVTLKALEGLHRESITDRLTGLYNYGYFIDELNKELARASRNKSPFALVLFDLDFFKQVNDTHGHEKGNLMLKMVADILKANARRMDTVARYGGEEFVILMPDSNGAEMEVAERIRKLIEATEFAGITDQPVRITISGGICTYPKDAVTVNALLDKADKGLYAAKTGGRNRTRYCERRGPA